MPWSWPRWLKSADTRRRLELFPGISMEAGQHLQEIICQLDDNDFRPPVVKSRDVSPSDRSISIYVTDESRSEHFDDVTEMPNFYDISVSISDSTVLDYYRIMHFPAQSRYWIAVSRDAPPPGRPSPDGVIADSHFIVDQNSQVGPDFILYIILKGYYIGSDVQAMHHLSTGWTGLPRPWKVLTQLLTKTVKIETLSDRGFSSQQAGQDPAGALRPIETCHFTATYRQLRSRNSPSLHSTPLPAVADTSYARNRIPGFTYRPQSISRLFSSLIEAPSTSPPRYSIIPYFTRSCIGYNCLTPCLHRLSESPLVLPHLFRPCVLEYKPATSRFQCNTTRAIHFNQSISSAAHTRIHTGVKACRCSYSDCGGRYSDVPPAIAADLDATTTGTVTVAVVTSAAEHNPNPSRTLEDRASEFEISETSYTPDHIMSSHARIGKRVNVGEKFYSCDDPKCGGKSFRHSNLHHHMRRKHNDDERPLKCSVDGCQFSLQSERGSFINTVGKPSDSDQQMPQYAPLLLFNFIPKPLHAITRSRVLDQQRGRVRQARKNRHSLRQKRANGCSCDPPYTRIPIKKGVIPSAKNLPDLSPPQGMISGPTNTPPLRSPLATSSAHHILCDSPSAMSEWSQPPDAQLERYEPVAAPRVPNRSGVPVFGSSSASLLAESPTKKGELCRIWIHGNDLSENNEILLQVKTFACFARYNGNGELEVFDAGTFMVVQSTNGRIEVGARELSAASYAISECLLHADMTSTAMGSLLEGRLVFRSMKGLTMSNMPKKLVHCEHGLVEVEAYVDSLLWHEGCFEGLEKSAGSCQNAGRDLVYFDASSAEKMEYTPSLSTACKFLRYTLPSFL
ncbi:uncharacterized protein BBA_09431 [Beauveria bassiana ARSEF 2860]|uniref:C2H2-type domain-containing protein n=1 Tax=Beauveria bassiana (strain ARSEF 2860) TaxID=655819 RepID=J5J4I5_BEAB2|nr:uncharacterized protein BBA_09431 [Beauveria bassiana ARSEF 2860]EJP61588.1 hypothetical protein BBA_09431 [Beauveria bassiana ARSEF 2860]